MKQQLALAALLLSLEGVAMAQNQIKTYSVYDVDHSNTTSVADATAVIGRVVETIKQDPQMVDATELFTVLHNIKSSLADLKQRLDFVVEKSNLTYPEVPEDPEEPDENGVIAHGYDYVDLGLPSGLLWATHNVGAKIPEEYGDFFCWGETEPHYQEGYSQETPCTHWCDGKSGYDWANYKWIREGYASDLYITKYTTEDGYSSGIWYDTSGNYVGDSKTVLDLEDDAAHANWGGSWRMPTYDEVEELINNCTWTSISYGYKATGPNGNSIFLPGAGRRNGTGYYNSSDRDGYKPGNYWTSSLTVGALNNAHHLELSGFHRHQDYAHRYIGFSVRPVCTGSK